MIIKQAKESYLLLRLIINFISLFLLPDNKIIKFALYFNCKQL